MLLDSNYKKTNRRISDCQHWNITLENIIERTGNLVVPNEFENIILDFSKECILETRTKYERQYKSLPLYRRILTVPFAFTNSFL